MKTKLSVVLEIITVYIMVLLVGIFFSQIIENAKTQFLSDFYKIVLYIVFCIIPILVLKLRKVSLSILGFRSENIKRQILIGLLICCFTIGIFVIIPLLLGMDKTEVLAFKAASIKTLVFFLTYDLLFVGFVEEVIFRGYFYGRLENSFSSKYVPIIVSAVLFGIFHFPGTQNIINVILTSIMGIIYGICRWKIKDCSLLSLSIAHGMNDATIILLSYLLL